MEDEVQMVTIPDEYVEFEDSDLAREIHNRKTEIDKYTKENETHRSRLETV